MPSNVVKSYAKKSGKSVASVEAAWKKAKRAVSKSYDPETNPNAFYGTVNKIVRRKLNLKENRTAKRFDMRRLNESASTIDEELLEQIVFDHIDVPEGFISIVFKICKNACVALHGDEVIDNEDYLDFAKEIARCAEREIDEGMTYTDDQWAMMAYYQEPSTADVDSAFAAMTQDVIDILQEYYLERRKRKYGED